MTGLEHGLGFDLELSRNSTLTDIGAVLGPARFHRAIARGTSPAAALADLDDFAAAATFVFGHNIYWHDLPHLARLAPGSAILEKPAVDTLLLSTLAFTEHPYHRLVKDYKLVRDATNDPVADARIAATLLADCRARLAVLAQRHPIHARVVRSLCQLATTALSPAAASGTDQILADSTPASPDLDADLRALLADRACRTAVEQLLPVTAQPPERLLPLLFAVAWLRVAATPIATSPSVPMPWVRQSFPAITELLHELRDVPCRAPECSYCRTAHDPVAQLQRWFELPSFRRVPTLSDHRPAQQAIVEAGFCDQPLLAVLPTGGGKSLCFQLPAIRRYLARGCMTIVISPLQSLMHDQVDNFRAKTRTPFAFALTGRLTPPERRATLDAVRSGEAGILYVSPEQLRNSTFKQAIARREIGAWVFDEAHCLSKWGHDFRPDYLYAARFIREYSAGQRTPPAPVVCVTATAKPEVREEIQKHFADELQQQLLVFDGHAERENLTLQVETVAPRDKQGRLCELVGAELQQQPTGSVLVYTATRAHAEDAAKLLVAAGIAAAAFHAGLELVSKKQVQEAFLGGSLRVVCATNAFGMGIDKPDIRLVVHFDIPGSLEAYVQEVGRAGRDGRSARALLLYAEDDVERQFRLAADSRLSLRDVQGILRRIRHLSRAARGAEVREAVCTTGEILQDGQLAEQAHTSERGAPTRVVTAIAWLERGRFLQRDENATTVFQGRPLVQSLDEARQRIASLNLKPAKAEAWLAIMTRLIAADADSGFSSDDFLDLPDLANVVGQVSAVATGRAILHTLVEMQRAGLLSSGVQMTAFVRHAVEDSSAARLDAAAQVERHLLQVLRQQQPDLDAQQRYRCSLRLLTQAVALQEPAATLDLVRTLLAAMADRSLHAGPAAPGLRLHFTSRDDCSVQVQGSWDDVAGAAHCRHRLAGICLQEMLAELRREQARGADLLAQFALEDLVKALQQDLELRSVYGKDPATAIEYALLFLHRVGAIVLHKGLAVFRQAMLLRVPQASCARRYTQKDYEPLAEHQDQRTVQIHVMREFAVRLQQDPREGLRLLAEYFRVPGQQFLARWFRQRLGSLDRATGPVSWQRIVEDLSSAQRRIVEASEDQSLLVLAGPGSGKTRVVVHRCAFLLRVKRVPARAILVLCFNRSAALELRRRLAELVGEDAHGVLIQTYHGMAARICGRSPAQLLDQGTDQERVFADLLETAIAQLAGSATSAEAGSGAEELRDRLLAGFRHILVDEYQDIDAQQYRLVSALAGRTLQDPERKLTVLAVGDDDQNIYRWRGSNVEFLRRFAQDYDAQTLPLVENYRSTAHIIAAANRLIAHNRDRLKTGTDIRIDLDRMQRPAGGRLAIGDPLARGQVHVLQVRDLRQQAFAVRAELQRLAGLLPGFSPEHCAVLARSHALLDPVRTLFEQAGLPIRYRVDGAHAWSLFRQREVQEFLAAALGFGQELLAAPRLCECLRALQRRRPRERGLALVAVALDSFLREHGEHGLSPALLREHFGELLQEQRRERTVGQGVMLSTVHGCKGEEYEHVFLLDGGWQPRDDEALEDLRRLYYVGMTRARQTLTLVLGTAGDGRLAREVDGPGVHHSMVEVPPGPHQDPGLSYRLLGPKDLWLALPGRDRRHAGMAAAIDRLSTGDPLRLHAVDGRVFLLDEAGVTVGALSQDASATWCSRLDAVVQVRVATVVVRRREDEAADYRDGLRREEWMVVVPEITLAE